MMIGEKGRRLGGLQLHLWIVSLLGRLRLSWMDHLLRVELERTLDGGRRAWSCTEVFYTQHYPTLHRPITLLKCIHAHGGTLPAPVACEISGDIGELADLCLRWDNDESRFSAEVGL